MRYLAPALTIAALFASIVMASISGFIGLAVLNEIRSICPDAFQCSDAQASIWLYLVAFVIFTALAVLLTALLKRLRPNSKIIPVPLQQQK